jgi:hypothetical protein
MNLATESWLFMTAQFLWLQHHCDVPIEQLQPDSVMLFSPALAAHQGVIHHLIAEAPNAMKGIKRFGLGKIIGQADRAGA